MSLVVWFVGGVLLGWGLYELTWWLVRRDFPDLFAPVACMDKTPPTTAELTAGVFGELADELDYYASKTDGGTYAGGLADAASKIRQVIDGTYLRAEEPS